MAFESFMIQTATIQSLVAEVTPHTSAYSGRWTAKGTCRCLIQNESGQEIFDNQQIGTVEKRYKVFFPPDASIIESDRISTIVDAAGVTVVSDLDILAIRRIDIGITGLAHHLEVDARLFVTTN